MPAKKADPAPTHYAVTLSRPFPVPGTPLVVPAGESTVSTEILALIPAEVVVAQQPAEA